MTKNIKPSSWPQNTRKCFSGFCEVAETSKRTTTRSTLFLLHLQAFNADESLKEKGQFHSSLANKRKESISNKKVAFKLKVLYYNQNPKHVDSSNGSPTLHPPWSCWSDGIIVATLLEY
jgi:hypothetical protein